MLLHTEVTADDSGVSPFGHFRIKGYLAPPRNLSQPYHVLHRFLKPRHPPYTLTFLQGTLYTAVHVECRPEIQTLGIHLCIVSSEKGTKEGGPSLAGPRVISGPSQTTVIGGTGFFELSFRSSQYLFVVSWDEKTLCG